MSARAKHTALFMYQRHVATPNGAEEHESSVANAGTAAAYQRLPLNIAKAVRVRLRIMDSKETRGTSMSLRSSEPRSKRCAALGMRAAARSKAPGEAARIPAIARE